MRAIEISTRDGKHFVATAYPAAYSPVVAERRPRGVAAAGKTDFSTEETSAINNKAVDDPLCRGPQTRSRMPLPLSRKRSPHAHSHKRQYEMATLRILPRLAAETGRGRDQSGGSAAPHKAPLSNSAGPSTRFLSRRGISGSVPLLGRPECQLFYSNPGHRRTSPSRSLSERDADSPRLHRREVSSRDAGGGRIPAPAASVADPRRGIQSCGSRDVRKLSTTKSATSLPSR
jgi:hypothetical protein